MGKYIDYLDIQEEVKAALEEHVNALSEKQVPCLQRSPS